MNKLIQTLELIVNVIQNHLTLTLSIVGVLWAIQLVNFLLGYRLNVLGIYPRHPAGLVGIGFSPFLHGHFDHLFFNSIPLFVLMNLVLMAGVDRLVCVTAIVVIVGGLGIWCFGRKALHVGSSTVIMGLWGYLLADAYQHPTLLSVILAFVCLYYFGGLLASFIPTEVRTSWEGHLFGFLGGLLAAFLVFKGYC